jgi:hypothetical protein
MRSRWQGKRVCQGEGGVVGSVGQELLPEALLNFQRLAAWREKVVRCTRLKLGKKWA